MSSFSAVALRLRKTKTAPASGSCWRASWQSRARPSIPRRKSAGSTATRIFLGPAEPPQGLAPAVVCVQVLRVEADRVLQVGQGGPHVPATHCDIRILFVSARVRRVERQGAGEVPGRLGLVTGLAGVSCRAEVARRVARVEGQIGGELGP